MANFAKRVGVGKLTEEHGGELPPTGEHLNVTFGPMFVNQFFEYIT
jgi:hypothetical protein